MPFTQGQIQATPAEIGYNAERLDVLNNHFQKCIDEKKIQCATYCLTRKGKVFAHGALGNRTFRDDSPPAKPDDIRYIASITKVFTAVAVMKLIEDGITRLDIPVGEILPQFNTPPFTIQQYEKTVHSSITLFHLLTHTSGMHADDGCFNNKYQTNYWKTIDEAYELLKLHNPEKLSEFDWLAASLGTIGNGLRVPVGTEWAYSSFGFVVLGAVIEKLTGVPAQKYIEDNICKPLGMKDTTFNLTPELAKRSIYTNEEHEKDLDAIIKGDWEPDWIGAKLKIPATGGGIDSTAYDLTRFGNMVLYKGEFEGVRILGKKAVEKMTTLAIHNTPDYCWGANTPNRGYGIGFDMRQGPAFTFSEGTFNHEGAGASSLYVDPKEELVAAWFVPLARDDEWHPVTLWNAMNIMWSGIK